MNYSTKEFFTKVLRMELAAKPVLCKFALELVDKIPEYFWVESASSSGKYHPQYALGDGGLARHSLMTFFWLKTLIGTLESDTIDCVEELVVAALFHDCCKRWYTEQEQHTVHEHPLLAAKFIVDNVDEFIERNKEFIDSTSDDVDSFKNQIAIVVSCIETHMGKWNTSKHSSVVLPVPKTSIQQLVHLADYISSRKETLFAEDYFNSINLEQ